MAGFISLASIACSRPSGFEVQQDLARALKSNESATSIFEWENSEYHSEALFTRWQEVHAQPESVCKGLSSLNGKEISFFEEEITSGKYAKLVSPCRQELLKHINAYWKGQKARIDQAYPPKQVPSDFKFPDNLQTRDVSHGYKAVTADLARKEVILTFDDGPHPEYTDQIIESLATVNAKAHFFTTGKNVVAHPEVLKRVAQGGHAIGSHSINHQCLAPKNICAKNNGRMLSFNEAVDQIIGGHQAVFNVLGWVDPFFRFPYGESSPELTSFLKENSVGEFYWSVDSEDWKNRTPLEILTDTLAQIEKREGGNILFHDIQRKTAEALPELLKQLYYKGYSIVLLQSSNPNDRTESKLVKWKREAHTEIP